MIPKQAPTYEEMRQQVAPPTNGTQGLYNVLGNELEKKRRMREIRMKMGMPEPRNQPMPNMQWMGDNQG